MRSIQGFFLFFLFCLQLQASDTVYYKTPDSPGQIRLQITVSDAEDPQMGIIEKVIFDGDEIPLQDPNPTRIRATMHTRVSPGKYELKWIIRKDPTEWPQTVDHEKTFTFTGEKQWIDILIEGNQLFIQ